MERTMRLHLTGTRPVLFHNGRLANPLDPHTRAIARIAKKRNKTDSDYAELAQIEARGGMYEAPGDMLGLPIGNVLTCLRDAGKTFKLGKAIEQAILLPDANPVVPVLLGGQPVACDTYLGGDEAANRLLYVSVVVNRRRTMRARALAPAGWEATCEFTVLTDVIQPEHLKPVIERAGRLGGLCDWRPRYGTFSADVVWV